MAVDPISPLFLDRDPRQTTRTRRFEQVLQGMLNSLLQRGTIIQTGPGTYELATTDQLILANEIYGNKTSYGMYGG